VRSDLPLFAVSPRKVFVRKAQIEIILLARPALCFSYALIVVNEACKMCGTVWRQGMDNSMIDSHPESA